jgi:hypothetical protein
MHFNKLFYFLVHHLCPLGQGGRWRSSLGLYRQYSEADDVGVLLFCIVTSETLVVFQINI